MPLYLPGFDMTLHNTSPWDVIPLRDQLVFSILTTDVVYISAASPFKNLNGWHEIQTYKTMLHEGLIRFPLDSRHQGQIERYIHSRLQKIRDAIGDLSSNPEYSGYTSPEAEDILNLLNFPQFTTDRPFDCDNIFRQLVAHDVRSETPDSIRGILYSKRIGFGKEDFLAFVVETANDRSKLFQRFNVVEQSPDLFVIDGVLKQRLYSRLDELFFLANAESSGISCDRGALRFEHTPANYLRIFSKAYSLGGVSLYDLLVSLESSAMLSMRNSEEMRLFLDNFNVWRDRAVVEFFSIMGLGAEWAKRDSRSPVLSRTLTSAVGVTVSELLGWFLSTVAGLPTEIIGKVASFVVGLLPWLALSIKKTPAYEVFKTAEKHPKMREMNQTIEFTRRGKGTPSLRGYPSH